MYNYLITKVQTFKIKENSGPDNLFLLFSQQFTVLICIRLSDSTIPCSEAGTYQL